ncbi:hypothetical protein IV102_34380 [bacterium]|nr:hypothetical protein [bacterium]
MRNIFKSGVLIWVAAAVWLGGCTSSPPPHVSDAKVYAVYKHKVSLTPPKDWKIREEKNPDAKDENAAIIFEPPTGYGRIAVTVSDGIPQTKDVMNRFYNGVRQRQGKILKQWYEHKLNDPDKENAYHMEYELKDAGPQHPVQKGMQVQIFTKQNVLYSLVFNAEPAVYDANRSTFLALVKSFELAP